MVGRILLNDCNLSCIVIVVHIRKVDNAVYQKRIWVLDKSNILTKSENMVI